MGKIFYIIGKSSSGKDTVYKQLLQQNDFNLKELVLYTTRPIRSGETEGVEYHFVTEEQYQKLLQDGKIIEARAYDTIYGVWRYFTVNDGQIDLERQNYLVTGTIASYCAARDYFGANKVIPIYIDLDDGIRLQRALNREKKQEQPKYTEMCRRFLADAEDFAPEKIKAAGIEQTFQNDDLLHCVNEIVSFIGREMK